MNTVIAVGNDHENLDETIDFGSSTVSSPYVITVDSAMANGKTSEFSSYGQTSTDVFAPGSNFMSTMAQEVTTEVEKETGVKSGYSKQIHYYPQATAEENRIAFETFADVSGVRVFKENPAIKADAVEISPTVDEGNGYGDQRSLAVKLSSLNKPDEPIDTKYIQGMLSTNGYVYLAIPVASAEVARNVKWASVDVALGDTVDVGKTFKPAGGFDTLTCLTRMKGKDADEPVEVSAAASSKLDWGWGSAASYTIYQTQWSNVTYNVDGLVGAYNEADERMEMGEEFVNSSQAGKTSLKNLGKLDDVYAWQPNDASGKTYVIARIAIGMATSDNKPTDNTTLYIDNVSLGNANAFTGAYETMPGTSMAAPAVASCLAVIAKDEAPNTESTDDAALELRARERKAKLLASVDYDNDLSTLCRTGGRVNMEKYVAKPSKLAPLPQYATAEGGVLTITGWFFGESAGALEIDGAVVPPKSWGAEKITADVSSLSNGSHVAEITNVDGAVSRIVFAHSDESPSAVGTPLYENTLAIPTSFPGHENDARIYGPMAGCGGSIYAQTASAGNVAPEALWRYDIAKGEWSRHALPAGYSPETYVGTEPSWNAPNSGGLVAYRDTLYLVGDYVQGEEKIERLWQYDAEKDSWWAIDMKLPSSCGALCVVDGDLLFVGGTYSFTFSDIENVCAVRVDVDNRKLTPIKAKTAEQAKLMEGGQNQVAVASSGKIYEYQLISDGESQTTHGFFRLTYDRASDTMAIEDLSAAYAKVGPALENSAEMVSKKAHVAIAGLPDGVAIIGVAKNEDGSYAIGQDTHVIYDDANEAGALERTSSYHRAFDPMATFYEGVLYVAGQNATEPDAMYFRSTKMCEVGKTTKEPTCTENGARELTCLYGKNKGKVFTETLSRLGHVWGEGEVTKAAAPGVAGVRTYTCSRCGETKAEPIAALPGGTVGTAYQVSGNTYKVTGKDTVTFAKAKNAKKATVPATVTINGKAYTVTAVAPKAFASAKKKLKNAVIGANVAKIDKGAFKGCKKLKTLIVKTKKLTKKSVKGCLKGSAVKTVKVKVGSKKANKTYAKKYKKIFTKKNCGKKVAVKA